MINDHLGRRHFLIAGGLSLAALSGGIPAAEATSLESLRSAIRGRVLLPGDPEFDTARTPWNLTVDQPVLAVAEVADADDAAALVRFARDTGLPLAAQLNGHGASSAADGAILVRTNRLKHVSVDEAAGTATAGAGTSWGDVQALAGPIGLTGVAGSSPAVGVTGYTLGGGLSWFSRMYGWAADSVIAFEAITAGGNRVRVTEDSEPDLFWALRGGGGDYALVTSLEFALKPAPSVYGGRISWPASEAPAVLDAFREITATAPDELTLWFSLNRIPGAAPMVSIEMTYLGDIKTGRALLQPLEALGGSLGDTRRALSPAELGTITNEPTAPIASRQRATMVTELTDNFVDDLLTNPIDPLVFVQIRHLGGALARPTGTPAGETRARYFVNFGAPQRNPLMAAAFDARAGTYLSDLAAVDTHRTPFNFLSPAQSSSDAFDPATLTRLRNIKGQRDPGEIFRSNHPVLA